MILVRLVAAPFILAYYLFFAIIFVIMMGLGWIFTGSARVNLEWPRWQ